MAGSPGMAAADDGDRDETVAVPCDTAALIRSLTEANTRIGARLSLAKKCTYTLTADQGNSNGLPPITQPMTILGNGATLTRAAAAPSFRILEIADGGDLRLNQVTISNGNLTGANEGGGVLVGEAGRLHLDRSTVTGNRTVTDGAGLYNEGITTLSDSTVSANAAGNDGGGLYNYYAKLTITKTRIIRNTAQGSGGGLYTDSGSVTVKSALFEGNSTPGDGGAIHQSDGSVDLLDATIRSNTAGRGGAVFHNNEGLHIRKSRLIGNTAATHGGALYLTAPAVIDGTLIQGNTALRGFGGGAYVATNAADQEAVSFQRSRIAQNQAPGVGFSAGGIYVAAGALVNLTDTEVVRNSSNTAPGGIFNAGTVNTFGRVTIANNLPTNCTGSPNPVPGCVG
ncbi:hypothetical protein [Streptomyces sp. cmx-4-9]|uniref:hypothetical protein n=1 Tax=Streptomyces sp. cmx-4-9 TaxID=2790941 RepID=UPI003980204F